MTDFKREYPDIPWADAVPASDAEQQRRLDAEVTREIQQLQLVGLANNTKWNELLAAMRGLTENLPGVIPFRSIVTNGHVFDWDTEWTYHPPFPLRQILCLDLCSRRSSFHQAGALLPVAETVIDHGDWLEAIIRQIGFDYRRGETMIRIFGYAPREMRAFDEQSVTTTVRKS